MLDVDGVLTSGMLYVDPDSGQELRAFHVHDGFAMRAFIKSGRHIIVCSGKGGGSIRHRMELLGITHIIESSADKAADVQKVLNELDVSWEHLAAIGDDLPDAPVLKRAGLSLAPANARPEVCARVDIVLRQAGGQGAVREAIEHILRASGDWLGILRQYEAVS
jgi:3-deoxy-D-manno-octulosonate 8-phosphate phosphatase (KDO 8-P phosphatase)